MKKVLYTLLAVSIIFYACEKEKRCTDVDNEIYYVQDDIGVMLDSNNHTGISAPHTISVVRPNKSNRFNNHTYYIYVGEQKSGNIDLWFAEKGSSAAADVFVEMRKMVNGYPDQAPMNCVGGADQAIAKVDWDDINHKNGVVEGAGQLDCQMRVMQI